MRTIQVITILTALLLLPSPGTQAGPKPSYWWHVVITVNVDGKYFYDTQNKGFEGEYEFTSVILGSLQEDDVDYIFVQAHQENKDMKWKETVFKNKSRQTADRRKFVQPEATLNYVFRKRNTLSFDFDFQPVPAPVKNKIFPVVVKQLRLPASAGDSAVNTRYGYNRRVVTGSNKVVIKYKSFYENQFNDYTFKWAWMENSKSWQHHHLVDVHVKIIRMEKKRKRQPR
jgi:hypothetical protein